MSPACPGAEAGQPGDLDDGQLDGGDAGRGKAARRVGAGDSDAVANRVADGRGPELGEG